MSETPWVAVDQYLGEKLLVADPGLTRALQQSEAAGLPPISVTPLQGKFLHLLARIQRATRILEVGTLGGYSTIWLARALPAGGRLITLELNPTHAAVARDNLAFAGLSERVELRLGPAADALRALQAEAPVPFDLIFIDADKPSTPEYFQLALGLARPGTVIVVDNVIRKGAVVDATTADANVRGIRQFMDLVAANPRVSATALQTVGLKGYDGFALVWVES